MLKLCHHVCLLKRIIEMHIVDIVTFNQTLESVCDRKLTVISQQLMTKLLDMLLTKVPVLLQRSLCYCSQSYNIVIMLLLYYYCLLL